MPGQGEHVSASDQGQSSKRLAIVHGAIHSLQLRVTKLQYASAPWEAPMTYALVRIEQITDPEHFQLYRSRVGPVVERFGGKYLAVDTDVQVREGNWNAAVTVLVSFPSMEQAKRFYDSSEYQEILPLRLNATNGCLLFIRGLDETKP
jgi:uncharacterized protein (DUF1330 family)